MWIFHEANRRRTISMLVYAALTFASACTAPASRQPEAATPQATPEIPQAAASPSGPDVTLAPPPPTTDTTKTNDQRADGWLNDVGPLPGEKFAGLSSNGKVVFYVSIEYRTTAQGTRIIFVHKERKLPSPGLGVLSSRETWELDCGERKSRVLDYTGFSNRNLEGNVLFTETYKDEWTYDAPNSMADGVDSIVCASRTPKALKKLTPPKKMTRPQANII